MSEKKTAVLSGGGTAGHINPALALAEELSARGWDVHFAGTPHGVESRLVPQAGIPFEPFEASGFRRGHPLSIVKGVHEIRKSTKQALKWFDKVRPDAVVGFGGYVSLPVSRAAEETGVPVAVHEQNSIMGLANKYLAKKAQAVCVTYRSCLEGAGISPDDKRVRETGNPVRRSVIDADRGHGREYLGIPEDAELLVAFGGSLGAKHLNRAVASVKDDLLSHPDLYVLHVSGPKDYEETKDVLDLTPEESERYILKSYEDGMYDALAAADCVLSRAGATSLAEISARRLPALLVPFPYAAEDHQTKNASEYVAAGAAYMFADTELESDEFKAHLMKLVEDAEVRAGMAAAAESFGTVNAAQALADVVEEIAG